MGPPTFIFSKDHTATRSDLMTCDKYPYNQNELAYFYLFIRPQTSRILAKMFDLMICDKYPYNQNEPAYFYLFIRPHTKNV